MYIQIKHNIIYLDVYIYNVYKNVSLCISIYVYIYISEKATAQQDKILRQTKKRQVSVDKSLVMKSDEGFLHSTGTTIIHGEALTRPIH